MKRIYGRGSFVFDLNQTVTEKKVSLEGMRGTEAGALLGYDSIRKMVMLGNARGEEASSRTSRSAAKSLV